MEFSDVLYSRRSTRAFTDKPVTVAQITQLLTAAINAPNACNLQSWHFYVVTDEAVRERMKTANVASQWAFSAPLVIVVCTAKTELSDRFDKRAETFMIQDTAAATENILLTAASMGLGGCWMGSFDTEACREILSIPPLQSPVALVPIGEPANNLPSRGRKPLSEVVTFIGTAPETADEAQPQEKQYKLCGAALPKAVFDDLNLDHATFNNINLHGAKFSDINMSNAFYGGMNMSGSFFGCVDLNDSTFENPCFDGSEFKNCTFKNVTFDGCTFESVKLENCDSTDIEVMDRDGKVTKIR